MVHGNKYVGLLCTIPGDDDSAAVTFGKAGARKALVKSNRMIDEQEGWKMASASKTAKARGGRSVAFEGLGSQKDRTHDYGFRSLGARKARRVVIAA